MDKEAPKVNLAGEKSIQFFEKSSQFPIGRKKIKMDQRFFEIIKLFTFVPPLFYWYGNRANYKNFFLSLLLLVQKIRFARYFYSHYSNGQKIDMGGHAFSLFLQNVYNHPSLSYWHEK